MEEFYDKNGNIKISVLEELLEYNSDSGYLAWRHRGDKFFKSTKRRSSSHNANIWNSRQAGKPAFTSVNSKGVRQGQLIGKNVTAHYIAWAMHYKEYPNSIIEAIDKDYSNISIKNYRETSYHKLSFDKPKSTTAMYCGLSYSAKENLFRSYATVNGKTFWLGKSRNVDVVLEKRFNFVNKHNAPTP